MSNEQLRALAGPPEYARVVTADNYEAARCYRGTDTARAESYATLFAAAPALREALRELEDIGTETVDDIEEAGYPARADRMVKAVTKARAVLALADGQVAGEASTDMFGNDLSKADSFGTAREAKL